MSRKLKVGVGRERGLEVLEKQNILFKHLKAKICVTFGEKRQLIQYG